MSISEIFLALPELDLTSSTSISMSYIKGNTNYELSNHLGNVLAVVSDRRVPHTSSGMVDYYSADIASSNDYYPFGMSMKERSFSSPDYRYGFNGKEKDEPGMGGGGSTYDYGFRIYNPQIAKFLSVDPLCKSFPWWTPYQFAGNTPIQALDLDGLEILDYRSSYRIKIKKAPLLYKGKEVISALAVNDGSFTPKYFKSQAIAMNDISLAPIKSPSQGVFYDATRAQINEALGQKRHRGVGQANKFVTHNNNYGPGQSMAIAALIDFVARWGYENSQKDRDNAYKDLDNMQNAASQAYSVVSEIMAYSKSKSPDAFNETLGNLGVSEEQLTTDLAQYVMDGTHSNPFDKEKQSDKYSQYDAYIEKNGRAIIDNNGLDAKKKKKSD